jgi:hypothetical protein
MKLSVKAFGLAGGLFWGVGLFLSTWWIIMFDGPTTEATFLGRLYRGYSITPMGSVVGLLWALIDGAVAGAIFAWLYNVISARLSTKKAHTS